MQIQTIARWFENRRNLLVTFLLLALVVVSFVGVNSVAAGGRPFSTELTGAAEVPGPGDPDGSGAAHLTINQGQGEVCFDITVADVAPITAAHIHAAPTGVAGSVVVNFNVAVNGLNGCVAANPDLIKAIRQNPADYYVNVHNASFPAGALRGQLGK
ncbi:MAG: CHRD domain-containing protein [Chloroflexi bacterium]|nr:CHRD domain-containing protein [Chloroflexota bacterium]